MCSKCYKSLKSRKQKTKEAIARRLSLRPQRLPTLPPPLSPQLLLLLLLLYHFRVHACSGSSACLAAPTPPPAPLSAAVPAPASSPVERSCAAAVASPKKRKVQKNKKRCFCCRKKVGLTRSEWKCGYVFCGIHRYPDQHECTFDFKAFDRAKIAKNNQKVVADKVVRF